MSTGNGNPDPLFETPSMKTLVTIGSAISALVLGWHHYGVTESKNASESKSSGSATELETTKRDVQTASARNSQGSASASATPQPTTKTNWIQERNSNWQSSLGRGAYDNRQAVTIVPSTVVVVPSSSGSTGASFVSPSSGIRPPSPGMGQSPVIRPPMNRPSSAPIPAQIPQRRPDNVPSAPPPSAPRGS
jgi:hypothetical protein